MSALIQVFAEYPDAGKLKKRMIPVVGEQGAAELNSALTEDMLWRLHGSVDLEIWGTHSAAKPYYRSYIDKYHCGFRLQRDGDPGARMEHAYASAFLRSRVPVLVNSAFPSIDVDLIDAMTDELDNGADAVMVPATDGSYAALGLAVKNYQLFRGVRWGSGDLVDQMLAVMFKTGIECAIFEPVQSVEREKDIRRIEPVLDAENDAELCGWIDNYF